MPRKCCVPGCRSNYDSSGAPYVNVFTFPKEESNRSKWLRQIHRKDFVIRKESVVCINHFDNKFIIREHRATCPDGTVLVVPRKVPILTSDAYPSIFPEQPKYLSSAPPLKRKDPNDRVLLQEQRAEEEFMQYLDDDKIKSFASFMEKVSSELKSPWIKIDFKDSDSVCIVKCDLSSFPKFPISIKVANDLSVAVWENGNPVSPLSLKWLFGKEQKCLNWSTFDSLISYLDNYSATDDDKINSSILLLSDCVNSCTNDKIRSKVEFITEQLQLCKDSPRYSSDFMVWACTFYYSYPTAYIFMRKCKILTLPHINHSKRILQCLGTLQTGLPATQIQYLKEKVRQLSDRESIVSLMMDEIYIKSEITYKGGKIEGRAENTDSDARTLQAFMISSLFSKNKDVVALYPVKDQTAEDLKTLLMCVLKGLDEAGYKVLVIISDNISVNTKLYVDLGGGQLLPRVPSPVGAELKIFLLFDTVHLLKNIRNNWLNQKDNNQTFYIPPFSSLLSNCSSEYLIASISHLKDIYYREKDSAVKLATSLTMKALWPSNLERQNVKHALRLFVEKLIPALDLAKEKFGDDVLGTAHFINIVSKWWKIVNTQAPYKGEHLRDSFCDPIKSMTDQNIKFLKEFCIWLKNWEAISVPSTSTNKRCFRLTSETHQALAHTTSTLIALCEYLLITLDPPAAYVLLGKLQTDCLEGRFGQYRGMSGCNYTVSIIQVLESERKLKLLSLLKLKSSKKGAFEIKDILNACEQREEDDSFWKFDSFFLVLELSESVVLTDSNKKAIIYIAGYVARVAVGSCVNCKEKLTINSTLDLETTNELAKTYLGTLDRGGLFWPNDLCIHVCTSTFKIFQILITKDFEEEFLNSKNQRKLLVELALEKLQIQENISGDIKCSSEKCKKNMDKLVYLCVRSMSNILLNNYCKKHNDSTFFKGKKRKLSTLVKKGAKKKKVTTVVKKTKKKSDSIVK